MLGGLAPHQTFQSSSLMPASWHSAPLRCRRFALPSVVMICCEWWTFEVMILMSGWMANPDVAVATMGVTINTSGEPAADGRRPGCGGQLCCSWLCALALADSTFLLLFALPACTLLLRPWSSCKPCDCPMLQALSGWRSLDMLWPLARACPTR